MSMVAHDQIDPDLHTHDRVMDDIYTVVTCMHVILSTIGKLAICTLLWKKCSISYRALRVPVSAAMFNYQEGGRRLLLLQSTY